MLVYAYLYLLSYKYIGHQSVCSLFPHLVSLSLLIREFTGCLRYLHTYGMFFGDAGNADIEVVLQNSPLSTPENGPLGNLFLAQGTVTHTYSGCDNPDSQSWTAFFTGGDRPGQAFGLVNNFNGRFRLEVRTSLSLSCYLFTCSKINSNCVREGELK